VNSKEIVQTLSEHLPQGELAQRSSVARETVSRWSTGAQQPSLSALEDLARAAGFQLDVRLLPAEPNLISKVHKLLDIGPTHRLAIQLAASWPAAREALRAAVAVEDVGVLVGPLASLIAGAPINQPNPSASLLIEPADRGVAAERLRNAGALPNRLETSPGQREHRELWRAGKGLVDLRWRLDGIDRIAEIHKRAYPAFLNAEDVGLLRVALVEDLLDIATTSPWPDEASLLPELRAVLASGRYSSRTQQEEPLVDRRPL
jgi:transcriptional regulator with XRE-family HTH domain